jgi:hypothetical protein
MYLELSRPRGEVGRWAKVYERLALFNEFVPVKSCRISREMFNGGLTKEETELTLNYIIENKRIFAGADLLEFYGTALKFHKQNTDWILTSKKPIIFYSSDTNTDAKALQSEFNSLVSMKGGFNEGQAPTGKLIKNERVKITNFSSKGVELIPSMKILTQGKKALVFIIDQVACHSYFNIPINNAKIMRIASMDTLITLYFSLGLINTKYFEMGSMECLANQLVQISVKARENPDQFNLPFISIKCSGHQTTLPSLIRAKVKRITQKKQEIKRLLTNENSKKNTRNTLKNNYRKWFIN